jgi:hypothetical protein
MADGDSLTALTACPLPWCCCLADSPVPYSWVDVQKLAAMSAVPAGALGGGRRCVPRPPPVARVSASPAQYTMRGAVTNVELTLRFTITYTYFCY